MAEFTLHFDRSVKPYDEILAILCGGEKIHYCFSNMAQDVIVFTDRRIIYDHKDGLIGAKHDLTTIPYRSFIKWHTVNAALIDMTALLEFWTIQDQYKITTDRSLDLMPIHKIISSCVL
jgi:hypothetical protein